VARNEGGVEMKPIMGWLLALMVAVSPATASETTRHEAMRQRMNHLAIKVWTNKQNIRFLQEAMLRLDARIETLRKIVVEHSHPDGR
jgi:hypothetical protein